MDRTDNRTRERRRRRRRREGHSTEQDAQCSRHHVMPSRQQQAQRHHVMRTNCGGSGVRAREKAWRPCAGNDSQSGRNQWALGERIVTSIACVKFRYLYTFGTCVLEGHAQESAGVHSSTRSPASAGALGDAARMASSLPDHATLRTAQQSPSTVCKAERCPAHVALTHQTTTLPQQPEDDGQ